MFPKKIIGRYTGDNPQGIIIGHINFKPDINIECSIDEDMYLEILGFYSSGDFEYFEFASVKEVKDLSNVVDKKFDDIKYKDNELQLYSKEVLLKTIAFPLPDDPREIELSKNDTHILWRIKPIGKELIKWQELIAISEFKYDDSNILKEIDDLKDRISSLENILTAPSE